MKQKFNWLYDDVAFVFMEVSRPKLIWVGSTSIPTMLYERYLGCGQYSTSSGLGTQKLSLRNILRIRAKVSHIVC